MKTKLSLLFFLSFVIFDVLAQNEIPPDWNTMMKEPGANFYSIRETVEEWFSQHPDYEQDEGDNYSHQNFLRWEAYWRSRVEDGNPEHSGSFHIAPEAYYNYLQSATNCHLPGQSPVPSDWKFIGPSNIAIKQGIGAVFSLVFDPSDPTYNTLLAGTSASGIWKTTNAQSASPTWIPLQDSDGEPGSGVADIVFDPTSSGQIIYIASARIRPNRFYGFGVFKSTNAGQDWQPTGLMFNQASEVVTFKLLIDPNNSNIIWALTEHAVYKSIDGGDHWGTPGNPFPTTPIPVFTYTPTQSGSGGQSWLINMVFDPLNSNNVYVSSNGFSNNVAPANQGARMYSITNGGTTSTDVTPGLIGGVSDWRFLSISTSASDPNHIFLFARQDLLTGFITQRTKYDILPQIWQPLVTTQNVNTYSNVLVSPNDPNIWYIGGVRSRKSLNSGDNWSDVCSSGTICHDDHRTLIFQQGSPNGTTDIVWIGTDGGVSKITYGTPKIENDKSGTGLTTTEFYGIGVYDGLPNKIIGGSQDNHTYLLNNGTWTFLGSGDGGEAIIDYTNPNHYYYQANNSFISQGGNGSGGSLPPPGYGTNWRLDWPMVIDPIDPNIVYCGMEKMWRYQNGAFQQTPVADFNNEWIGQMDICKANNNVMYAGRYYNTWTANPTDCFFVTNDLLNTSPTWTDLTANLSTATGGTNNPFSHSVLSDVLVKEDDPNTVWITFGSFWSYKIFVTTDGGQNWTDLTANLPNFPTTCIVRHKVTGDLYLGTDVGVYILQNVPGAQWECFSTNLPFCVAKDLEINYCANKLRLGTHGWGLWETDLAPSAVTLPANTTWSTPVKLTNDLIVPNGVQLTINTDVDIARGRRITVQSGGELDVINGHLFNGCGEMWDDIHVESGGTLVFLNSVIEHSYHAAYVEDNASAYIVNSDFDKNYVSVHVPTAPSGLNNINLTVTGCTFTCSGALPPHFSNPTLSGTKSYAAIELHDVSYASLGSASSNTNYVSSMENGIVMSRSNADIENFSYSNIHSTNIYHNYYDGSAVAAEGAHGWFNLNVTGAGVPPGITVPEYIDCDFGIYISGTMSATITNNYMNDVDHGITVQNGNRTTANIYCNRLDCNFGGVELYFNDAAQSIWVHNNEINIAPSSAFATTVPATAITAIDNNGNSGSSNPHITISENSIIIDRGLIGIDVNNVYQLSCGYNTIALLQNNNSGTSDEVIGIAVQGSDNGSIECNSVSGIDVTSNSTQTGYYFSLSDNCTIRCNSADENLHGFRFDGPCASTIFKGNFIFDHYEGLHLNVNAIIGLQHQAGNQWLGAFGSSFGAVNNNTLPVALQSKFIVEISNGPVYFPAHSPATWFSDDPNNGNPFDCTTAMVCISALGSGGGPGEMNLLDTLIAMDIAGSVQFPGETKWMCKKYFFEKAYGNSSLINTNALADSFYTAMQNTVIDGLSEINNEYKEITSFNLNDEEILTLNDTGIIEAIEALRVNDSLLLTGLSSNDSLMTLSENLILKNQIETLTGQSKAIMQVHAAVVLSGVTGLISDVSFLSASELIETNEKVTSEIYFNTIAKGIFTFTQQQQDQLLGVAVQCPYVGGNAVYKARGMYSLINPNMFWNDPANCLEEGIFRQQNILPPGKNDSSLSAMIFPNPAKDIARLRYNLGNNDYASCQIKNALGGAIGEIKLTSEKSMVEFSTEKFSSGVYYFLLTSANHEQLAGKFMVVK